jgi:Xaa-Pro aminopeptidase
MRYTPLSSSFYKSVRSQFQSQMKERCLAIYCSNDTYPTGADGHLPFKQASDIFYFTGVDQEESILIQFPNAVNPAYREILFLKETSELIAIWEGAKLTKEQAKELTGVQTIIWLKDFEKTLRILLAEAEGVYLNDNPHMRASVEVETREMRFSKWFRGEFPHYTIHRSAPIAYTLRSIKHQEEVNQLQQAIDITRAGFERTLKFVQPGVKEYEIEAEYMHEFLRRGSRGFAYTPIIASGASACVLHYIENDKTCHDGDLLLMDVGAEYGNYCADMTRCIPVNGKFNPRQKEVYNAVLRVMNAAKKLLQPGLMMSAYHAAIGEIMTKELIDLKLITTDEVKNQNPEWPAYKKYFMHGTSHFLGIDVHDVGHWHHPIAQGNVFTIEPGIYIPAENLGIRIENNIVIDATGNIDLFKDFPTEVEEIEAMMAR